VVEVDRAGVNTLAVDGTNSDKTGVTVVCKLLLLLLFTPLVELIIERMKVVLKMDELFDILFNVKWRLFDTERKCKNDLDEETNTDRIQLSL